MDFSTPEFTTIHHRNMWGEWTFVFEGSDLCSLKFTGPVVPSSVKASVYSGADVEKGLPTKVVRAYRKVVKELNQYLEGKLKKFTIPVKIYGTEFQRDVLEAIRDIPYGKTWTYKELANYVKHPNAERSVGNALHQNPVQIILPCHRVVSSSGDIGGYTLGQDLKRRLLCMEGAIPQELALE